MKQFEKNYKNVEKVTQDEAHLIVNENYANYGNFLSQPLLVEKVLNYYGNFTSSPVPRGVKNVTLAKRVTKSFFSNFEPKMKIILRV